MIQACLAETQRGDSIIALNYIVKMDKDVEFHPDVGDDWSWSAYAREARRAASHTFSFKRKDVILTYLDVNAVTITSAPSVMPLSEVPPSSITTGARAEIPTGPPNLVTFQPKIDGPIAIRENPASRTKEKDEPRPTLRTQQGGNRALGSRALASNSRMRSHRIIHLIHRHQHNGERRAIPEPQRSQKRDATPASRHNRRAAAGRERL